MAEAARRTLTDLEELRRIAVGLAHALVDRRAEDVVVLQVRELLPLASFFVVATAPSGRAGQTLADEAQRLLDASSLPRLGIHGRTEGRWICLDHAEVVVHIFERDARKYYDLENLWAGAPRVEI